MVSIQVTLRIPNLPPFAFHIAHLCPAIIFCAFISGKNEESNKIRYVLIL